MPTKIAWTDETWNPVHGCSKVSAGCDNCYAERISYHTYGHTDLPWTPENAAENVTERPDKLDYPSTLYEPKRIFVNSMSDLFHGEVSEAFIRDVFRVMGNHPEHIFQILTKRPGRAANMELQWPPNVWMGTSVEDERVVERLNLLRGCDADVLFVSFEPLIGPVAEEAADLDLSGFDWAIVGGESGPNEDRREMAHEWVWPIRRACMQQDVAFFFKQSSAAQPEQGQALRCPDGVRREFREMPQENEAVVEARNADRELVTDGGCAQNGDGDPEWVCKHCGEPTATPVEVAEQLRPMCPSCWRDGQHLPAES
jgi:protein gp37